MPTAFIPAKCLKQNYADYIGSGIGLPVLATDQEGKALVYDISSMKWISSTYPEEGWKTRYKIPGNANRSTLHEEAIEGDSGRPVFFVCGTEVILLGAFWKGYGQEATPATVLYLDDVQTAMNELSIANSAPQYSLQLFDMSPYDPIAMEP